MISSNLASVELDPRLVPGVRDAERGLLALGQRFLAALGLQEQVVQDFGIIERVAVLAGLSPELLRQVHHDRLIPEHAPQPVVAAGADHADQPVLDLDHRDVERAAPQVVDQDGLVFTVLEAIGDGGGGRLVQDGPHVQAGQAAGVGRRLALGRSEIRRTGDHDLADLFAERDLGVAHDFAQDERRDVLGAVRLPVILEDEIGIAHALLDRAKRRDRGSTLADSLAVLPTMMLSPSNRTTDGVIRSLSWLGTMTGFPCSSTYAIAE